MKHKTFPIIWVPVIAAVLAFLPAGRAVSQETLQVLDRPFPYDIDRTDGPLAVMGEFLRDTGLSGGVVLTSDSCEDARPIHWSAKQGSTFRQVLDSFQADNPAYRWQLRGNVLNLVPAAGIPPLLATKIVNFELTDNQTTAAAPPQRLLDLPEIRQAAAALQLREGAYMGGPGVAWDYSSGKNPPPKPPSLPIHLELKNVSLQDALNAVAQAYGHSMWWYKQRACGGQETYTVEQSQSY